MNLGCSKRRDSEEKIDELTKKNSEQALKTSIQAKTIQDTSTLGK
jgi:hypothetical protein